MTFQQIDTKTVYIKNGNLITGTIKAHGDGWLINFNGTGWQPSLALAKKAVLRKS
jgi:hypothetical protein